MTEVPFERKASFVPAARASFLAVSLLSSCGGARTAAPTSNTAASGISIPAKPIQVQGHRGARARYPENTLPAFAYALEVGVDTLELDVAITKDDEVVVMHDLAINEALCLGPGGAKIGKGPAVRTLTLKEVREYDCGSLKNEGFPGQVPVPGTRIPTLGEVFDLVVHSPLPAAKRVTFYIETKSLPAHPELTPPIDDFVRRVVAEIKAHGMVKRVTIQSFDHRTLVSAKRVDPALQTSALIEETLPNLVRMAEDLRADVVSPNLDWIIAEDVRALHAKGIRVVPWTANTTQQWDYLVGIHVDGIISDDPASLIAYLKSRTLR